jgi:hypothetical protein
LIGEHLLLLDQERESEEAYNDVEKRDNVQLKELTFIEFEATFRAVQIVRRKIINAETYLDRSIQIRGGQSHRI